MELPRLVRLGPNLVAAAFPLMKVLPARFIVEQALRSGALQPAGHIVETTSGTFGLGLALVGNRLGLRVTLVSDPVIDAALRHRLELLGARVEIVAEPAAVGGFQQARLDRVAELLAVDPAAFCPRQYDNPDGALAYAPFAAQLVESVGVADCVVGPTGSGGSMCGTTSFLRILSPDLRAVAVDTHGSVLFGHTDRPRLLRGLGNSVLPDNLDHTAFDAVHWVTPADAFRATLGLYRKHGLFMGPTSGAAYLVASWWAEQQPDALVVVLFPDEGHRYQATVYDDDWLHRVGVAADPVTVEPVPVGHPGDAPPGWAWMAWARRSYAEVMGVAPTAVVPA